ncbi:hypothetical protein IAR55_000901 [Kwoniella newhampshirensis]|uniref:Uncharacterized protein n=1 Tax=Kwoniella newhampshirensis TaxID=1651941 RepID=A0AAW0Z4C0_9TREE
MTSTNPNPSHEPPRSPATPPPSSHAMTSSPPSSPSSSDLPHSDDEALTDLSDSWMEVESSVAPSVLGDLSDTSSDSQDQDHESRSNFLASADREDSDNDDHDTQHDAVVINGSPSLAGGDYTDAEASTSKLGSSMDTIQQDLDESTSSSQIRLIFPDPGASFSTISDSFSEGVTPNAVNMNAHPFLQPENKEGPRADAEPDKSLKSSPRRRSSPIKRGIEGSWLHSSSKLWEISSPATQGHEYELLSSTDDMKVCDNQFNVGNLNKAGPILTYMGLQYPLAEADNQEEHGARDDRFRVTPEVIEDLTSLDHRAKGEPTEDTGSKNIIKKWMSVIALASVLSVAFGSYAVFRPLDILTHESAALVQSTESPKCYTLWAPSISSLLEPKPLTADNIDAGKPPGVIADLQIIKQALSTFSTPSKKAEMALQASTTNTPRAGADMKEVPRRPTSGSSTSCCSVAVRRDQVVALTVPPSTTPFDHRSMAEKWSQKLLGSEQPKTFRQKNVSSSIVPKPDCACDLLTMLRSEVLSRLRGIAQPTKTYALMTSRYIDYLLGPIFASLDKELGDLLNFVLRLGKLASSASHTVFSRASRGAIVLSSNLRQTQSNISNFFTSHKPASGEESLARAQAMLDTLSDYVEARLDGLSEMIEEQADTMQEKGMDSIKKAKRGLDKLIRDAKRLGKDGQGKAMQIKMDVGKDGPLPFKQMTSKREKRAKHVHRSGRRKIEERDVRLKKFEIPKVSYPPPQPPSRAKRIFDMIHHGAVALVV